MFKLSEMFGQRVWTLLDGELSKTSEFGRTLDKHLLKLAPLVGYNFKHFVQTFYIWWPLVTSILTWPEKFLCKSCRSLPDLSYAVCRLSLRCLVFEIWRGPKRPPAQNRTFQSPPGIGFNIYRLLMWLFSNNVSWPEVLLTFIVVFLIP